MKISVKHLLWFLLAPFMFFFEPRPWYKKAALFLLSPATVIPVVGLSLFLIILYAAEQDISYEVEYQYKNATALAAVTHAPIPACDTLTAAYSRWKGFESVEEKFQLRHPLTQEEVDQLHTVCTQSRLWSETDSTFVYDPEAPYKDQPEMWPDWEYSSFTLTIPKKQRQMVLVYEYVNRADSLYPKRLPQPTDR